jgi:hypothetical protein
MLERDHSATPLPLIDRFFGTLLVVFEHCYLPTRFCLRGAGK